MEILSFVFDIIVYVITHFSVTSPNEGRFRGGKSDNFKVSSGQTAHNFKGLWL